MFLNLAKAAKAVTLLIALAASLFQAGGQPSPQDMTGIEETIPAAPGRPQVNDHLESSETAKGGQINPWVGSERTIKLIASTFGETGDPDDEGSYIGEDSVCSAVWSSTPKLGAPPFWLSTPVFPEILETDVPYTYLAGNLIQHDLVPENDCPNDGLLSNGFADPCGLEKARPVVKEWQNQFDGAIFQYSIENRVPAQLLKRMFAEESQFWPGITQDGRHVGLGHTTETGLDTLLVFYPQYHEEICTSVFSSDACRTSYDEMSTQQKAMLRGYLYTNSINGSCEDCPNGIDLEKFTGSIDVFAKLVVANCQQTSQIIYNVTGVSAGSISGYEDLWSFTLANYNAGSGCMAEAVKRTFHKGQLISWENVSGNFKNECAVAVGYVENIKR